MTLPPWHWPQLPVMPVCSTAIARQGRAACSALGARGVADRAGLVAGIRHVAGRQRVAVPVRRGVADGCSRSVPRIWPRGVIGRAALQRGARRAHVEREARFVAGVAGGGHEGVLGRVMFIGPKVPTA